MGKTGINARKEIKISGLTNCQNSSRSEGSPYLERNINTIKVIYENNFTNDKGASRSAPTMNLL
ncbi:MAG: hypothetical protein QNJ51_00695 [Calothrix sp. MO_167.B12]|nr:hypothetical protein [Calothrix sp. MO_167.B12]